MRRQGIPSLLNTIDPADFQGHVISEISNICDYVDLGGEVGQLSWSRKNPNRKISKLLLSATHESFHVPRDHDGNEL